MESLADLASTATEQVSGLASRFLVRASPQPPPPPREDALATTLSIFRAAPPVLAAPPGVTSNLVVGGQRALVLLLLTVPLLTVPGSSALRPAFPCPSNGLCVGLGLGVRAERVLSTDHGPASHI